MDIPNHTPYTDPPDEDAPVEENQPAGKKPRPKQIALCLSGGGYRAALFHLGVMRYLHETGILPKVESLSSVSGGSIISAFLARQLIQYQITDGLKFTDWEKQVSAPFRKFVLNDIRTIPVLANILWNWIIPKFQIRYLERYYKKLLTTYRDQQGELKTIELEDLPAFPFFTFCASDLTFGVNWEFTREWVGDYQVGYSSPKGWSLAKAIACSSCFPPVFGPYIFNLKARDFKKGKYQGPLRKKLMASLSLSDGGVYDNLGIQPVIRTHSTIFVSDGGIPFNFFNTRNPLSRITRYTGILMNQVLALRKAQFYTGITQLSHKGGYMSIGSGLKTENANPFNGYSKLLADSSITKIRTDLDRFNEAEACILENHGYFTAKEEIKKNLPDLVKANFVPSVPHHNFADEAKVKEALKTSSKRFSIKRLFRMT